MLNGMKQRFFICLFVLLLPFSATAKELTAIGFVEDKKAFDLDGNYIRLAFVRTDKGWFPSCDFSEGDDAGGIFKNIKSCSHKIMKQSWQVINADGKRVDAGTLKFMRRKWSEVGLAKSSLPLENKIQFDSLNRSRRTWMGDGMHPLLAVPQGTNVEKIEPVAMSGSVEQKIKDKLVKQYYFCYYYCSTTCVCLVYIVLFIHMVLEQLMLTTTHFRRFTVVSDPVARTVHNSTHEKRQLELSLSTFGAAC